jgi:hypothetical protein
MAAVVEPSAVGAENDARGLTAPAGEAIVQDVGRVLGLDSRNALAVVELAAGAALQRDDGDRDQQPYADHAERVPSAVAAKAVQECTHEILLESARGLRDTATIQERADLAPRSR